MKQIRVLVVDDSAFMRQVISGILNKHPNITVVGKAKNGKEMLKKVNNLKPDVITLDVQMPIMDGVSALQYLLNEKPVPVVIISVVSQESIQNSILAMGLGAIDFIKKPSFDCMNEIESKIVKKVIRASKVQLNEAINLDNHKTTQIPQSATVEKKPKTNFLVGIGTSTGGPRALHEILTCLPKEFPSPILIVQHMPVGFTGALASRLNSLSKIEVKEAEDGDFVKSGVAYIAPGGSHMKIVSKEGVLRIILTRESRVNGHRPSVDVLFESLASIKGYSLISVILTGMGSDGTMGICKIKEHNISSKVIAESEDTCVVYGMPRSAIKTNLVDEVVDLHDIPQKIIEHIKREG